MSESKLNTLLEGLREDAGVETLDEGTVPHSLVKELAALTDRNNHTYARVLIARRVLRDKKLEEALAGLDAINNLFGGISGGLRDVRDKLYDMVTARMKSKLSPEAFKVVYGAL